MESREEKGVERSGVEGWKRSEAKGEQRVVRRKGRTEELLEQLKLSVL